MAIIDTQRLVTPVRFARPPISEVVLSIQFTPLTAFRMGHVGLLWNEFRSTYPFTSEQAPLPPVFETFGAPPGSLTVQFNALFAPPLPRVWFESGDGAALLQFQPDRFIRNWRRRSSDQLYPGYKEIRAAYLSDIETLERFLAREGLGRLMPNQCEVTYINAIELPGDVHAHQHLDQVTPGWTPYDTSFDLESVNIQSRYVLRSSGQPIGRLYLSFAPAFLAINEEPIVQLEITARAKPTGETIADALGLLDEEHDAVLSAFEAAITPGLKQGWGATYE